MSCAKVRGSTLPASGLSFEDMFGQLKTDGRNRRSDAPVAVATDISSRARQDPGNLVPWRRRNQVVSGDQGCVLSAGPASVELLVSSAMFTIWQV